MTINQNVGRLFLPGISSVGLGGSCSNVCHQWINSWALPGQVGTTGGCSLCGSLILQAGPQVCNSSGFQINRRGQAPWAMLCTILLVSSCCSPLGPHMLPGQAQVDPQTSTLKGRNWKVTFQRDVQTREERISGQCYNPLHKIKSFSNKSKRK